MTAEIAILNRSGIALAADSAVTIGRKRVWKNTNKLFSLGPHNDIGIMIYGSGDFNGFHWDTVIKSFREHVKSTRFDTVDECRASFRQFLQLDRWNDDNLEDLSISCLIMEAIEEVKDGLVYSSKAEFRSGIRAKIKYEMESIQDNDFCLTDLNLEDFRAEFNERIFEFAREQLQEFLTKPLRELLSKYVHQYVIRSECTSGYETGVVFAGFGENEFFPCLIHTIVDGKFGKFIRIWEESRSDLNVERQQRGVIVPFAQRDMMNLFMEGVGVDQIIFIGELLKNILDAKSDDLVKNYVVNSNDAIVENRLQKRENEQIMAKVMKEFSEFRKKNTTGPMMSVVSALPREEMAEMAASLVELTSLRRKVDSQIESVGGPVDVAIISKGDGFIWFRRKNYFDIKDNMDYSSRRRLRLSGDV